LKLRDLCPEFLLLVGAAFILCAQLFDLQLLGLQLLEVLLEH
jgi:hypothetical protein